MWLSDTSVRRPVLAMVMNLILIAFGIVARACKCANILTSSRRL